MRGGPRGGELEEKIRWATAMAPSTLLPAAYVGAPANLLVAAEFADALGIPRMAALTGLHIIHGKPTLGSDLMASLVRTAGHTLRVEGDASSAKATLIRSDDPSYEYTATWTIGRAEKAGLLSNPTWKAYPEALLRARAVSEVCRMGASDALFGAIYVPEELGVEVDATGAPIEGAPPPSPAPVADPKPKRAAPLVGEGTRTQIRELAGILRLTDAQVVATAKFCGHQGGTLEGLTQEVGQMMVDYMEERAGPAEEEEGDVEVIDAEIVEDPDEEGTEVGGGDG